MLEGPTPPGTIVWEMPMELYSAGYPNDYINYVVLDPPAVVTTDSFFVTWKPQVVANPFPSCDWDAPLDVGNDWGTNPGSEDWIPLNIGGAQTDANSDLLINAKAPATWRERIPLLVRADDSIMWVCGWRVDQRARIRESTSQVAIVHLTVEE